MKSPSVYGGGIGSPGFQTPLYNVSGEFSQHHQEGLPSTSPIMSKTPIYTYNINPSISTPIQMGQSSPMYINANTSSFYRGSQSSYSNVPGRSPGYHQVSNSPNYSSSNRSHSPDYNSSMRSSGRYGNSPNYTPNQADNNKEFKNEEDQE
jgi:hypothetical protein